MRRCSCHRADGRGKDRTAPDNLGDPLMALRIAGQLHEAILTHAQTSQNKTLSMINPNIEQQMQNIPGGEGGQSPAGQPPAMPPQGGM